MSAPSPTCCLGQPAVYIKCFYPYAKLFPCVLSGAICWGIVKEFAGGVQLHNLLQPDLVSNTVWQTPLLLCPSPDHPSGPRHCLYLLHGPGRQGRQAASAASPGLRASSHEASMAGTHHGDSRVPNRGRREGDLSKSTKTNQSPQAGLVFFSFLSS